MNLDILKCLLTGCFTLVAVYFGSWLSTKQANKHYKIELLTTLYADVFSAYVTSIPFDTLEKKQAFISCAEKLRLVCNSETSVILSQLINSVLKNDKEKSSLLINQLRETFSYLND